ncbi:MAG: HAMP domain-containing protein [Desulfobacterales bacterium]|nr:HAMP domain-containing protein [Desulfobacterales bacterium]
MKKFVSLKRKITRNTMMIVTVIFIAVLSVIIYMNIRMLNRNLVNSENNIRNSIIAKGNTLTYNNSLVMGGMVDDNAVTAIQNFVSSTVKEDPDILYGIFMDKKSIPWVFATSKNPQGTPEKREPLTDSSSTWAKSLAKVDNQQFIYDGDKVIEFAAPVTFDDEVVGYIRYGISAKSMENAVKEIKLEGQNDRNLIIKILVSLGLISLVFCYFIVRISIQTITRSINDTVLMIKDIAEGDGDLTKRLKTVTNDEVGELSNWFNLFVAKLQEMIQHISGNADTLNTSSYELAGLSSQLANGINQINDKSNTVANLTGKINSNMDSVANSMKQSANDTVTLAGAVEEMNTTIKEISTNTSKAFSITEKAVNQSKNAKEKMQNLEAAADKISSFAQSISDISHQTNLLALNATIEAARAGDAGRGFSVVASEVKELSVQSAKATKDITDCIKEVQSATVDSIQSIEQISTIINDVNEIVSMITSAVEEQSITTQEIAKSISQLSSRITDINQNIAQNSEVIGKSASDISEISNAIGSMSESGKKLDLSAENLAQLSIKLKEMMNKFKV